MNGEIELEVSVSSRWVSSAGTKERWRPVEPEARHLRAVPDAPTVESLLLKAAKGDRDAYAQLYDRVASRVYGIALRVVVDPAQSEEVAQEALLDVWRRATRFDPARGSAMAWIITIAHRRAVDRVRSEEATRRRHISEAQRAQHSTEDVADTVVATDERIRVEQALAVLTELQREAVVLAYYGGHTYREVSELLGVPLGTVKTRMRDGLLRLRQAMGSLS